MLTLEKQNCLLKILNKMDFTLYKLEQDWIQIKDHYQKEQQCQQLATSHSPKLRPEPRLPGDMITTVEETPFDPCGETATNSLPARELFREGGRSGVP